MHNDIVARLRDTTAGYTVQTVFDEAADEIERLREMLRLEREECAACAIDRKETQRERDEARALFCRAMVDTQSVYQRQDGETVLVTDPADIARMRGWHLYRKDGTNGD